jgi:hypothetical protein
MRFVIFKFVYFRILQSGVRAIMFNFISVSIKKKSVRPLLLPGVESLIILLFDAADSVFK